MPLHIDHEQFINTLDGEPNSPETVIEDTSDPRIEHIKDMIEKSKPLPQDGKRVSADRMTLEQFIEDYVQETDWISKQIMQRNKQKKKPLKAKSFFQHLDGSVQQIIVDVVEYDDSIKKFFIEHEDPTKKTMTRRQCGRLNL